MVRVKPSPVPPEEYDPGRHVLHESAPASEYLLSAPHETHRPSTTDPYVPAGQDESSPPDGHDSPVAHFVQVVLVTLVPPDVLDPVGHVRHFPAALSLYSQRAPHSWQTELFVALKYPAAHAVCVLLPSHVYPAGQSRHVVRVVMLDRDEPTKRVENPAAHVLQSVAPGPLYFLSPPQGVSVLPPLHAWPARHDTHPVCVLVSTPPVVEDPAGHTLHTVAPADDEYLLSSPHAIHFVPMSFTNLPGEHSSTLLVPSQAEPDWHFKHDDRVFWSFPFV